MPEYICSLDLAQGSGATAFVAAEIKREEEFIPANPGSGVPKRIKRIASIDILSAERFSLGTKHTEISSSVLDFISELKFSANELPELLIDANNNGPFIKLIKSDFEKAGNKTQIVSVTITGGGDSVKNGYNRKIPKAELVQEAKIALEKGLIKIPRDLPNLGILTNELESYQVEPAQPGAEFYNARTGKNDDLVWLFAWLSAPL